MNHWEIRQVVTNNKETAKGTGYSTERVDVKSESQHYPFGEEVGAMLTISRKKRQPNLMVTQSMQYVSYSGIL